MNTLNLQEKKTDKIARYAQAIRVASKAAIEASRDNEDGGTCNMDSVTIDFKGWRTPDVEAVAGQAGISIGDKLMSTYWKGFRFIDFNLRGQGANRTRMAEAAYKILQELDIPASMYYQMD